MKPFIFFGENAVVLIQTKITGEIVVTLINLASYFIGNLKVFCPLAFIIFHQQRQAGYLQYQKQQEHRRPSYEQEYVTQGELVIGSW